MRTLLCGLVAFAAAAVQAAPDPAVEFDTSDQGRLGIVLGAEPIAEFAWDDKQIPRPYFSHLRAPDGTQVTRTHPPDPELDVADHPTFHPGLWLAFGDISGNDYWRLQANITLVDGSLQTASDDNSGTFQARFQFHDQQQPEKIVCTEQFRCAITPQPDGYLLQWDSEFTGDEPFYFGDQEEMGLGIRVATPLRAENRARGDIPPGAGQIVDAEGRINGEQVWGNSSPWCDYRGQLNGKVVGMTLLCHPENFRPSWYHARDYGLLVANAFGRQAFRHGEASRVEVDPGEKFRLRYGVLVYAAPATKRPELAEVYQRYLQLTGATPE